MQFLGKFSKIVCWCPPRSWRPSSGKSWIRHCIYKFIKLLKVWNESVISNTNFQEPISLISSISSNRLRFYFGRNLEYLLSIQFQNSRKHFEKLKALQNVNFLSHEFQSFCCLFNSKSFLQCEVRNCCCFQKRKFSSVEGYLIFVWSKYNCIVLLCWRFRNKQKAVKRSGSTKQIDVQKENVPHTNVRLILIYNFSNSLGVK